MNHFQAAEVLPLALYERVIEIRVSDPNCSLREAQRRIRRPKLAPRSKLNIIAADHPARGVLSVSKEPIRMANRRDYLGRVLRVLSSDMIDGVMATILPIIAECEVPQYCAQKRWYSPGRVAWNQVRV